MSTGSQRTHAPRTQESALVSVMPMHPARPAAKACRVTSGNAGFSTPRPRNSGGDVRWYATARSRHFRGVSKALVIAYFGSKEELYIACVERAGQTLATAIGEALSVGPTGADAGERVLAAIRNTCSPVR